MEVYPVDCTPSSPGHGGSAWVSERVQCNYERVDKTIMVVLTPCALFSLAPFWCTLMKRPMATLLKAKLVIGVSALALAYLRITCAYD